MKRAALALAAFAFASCPAPSQANARTSEQAQDTPVPAPPPPAERVEPGPVAAGQHSELIRTTLVVRDIEASLALYRDALGMAVVGDREIGTDNISAPHVGEPGARGRFAVLLGQSEARWMIGLIQWTDPPMPDAGPYDARLAPGSVVFVIRVADARHACAKAAEVPQVTITQAPEETSYPGPDGELPVRFVNCTLFDPDGNLLELSQRLG